MTNATPPAFRRHAARLVLLLMIPFAGLAGCDAILGSDAEEEGIEGTWVFEDGDFRVFLRITSTDVTVWDGMVGDCYYMEEYTITAQDGDEYTLTEASSSFSLTITIRREGDTLVIGIGGEQTEVYQSSDQDVTQLEICPVQAGGGDDPAIDCSALPAITVGQTINGELNTGDTMADDGRYFDLYGLTLGGQTTVQIDAVSDPIDTYLYLYEDDGTFIAENDDADINTFNSRINTTLTAGCYRVEVTSFGSGETGTYSVSVN
jgi:hypothetical protein